MEEYNQKCRSHPEEQALYICTHSTCLNVMFCYKCINNHQEHPKQLMNKSTAIITIEQVSSDLKQFLNLFQNKQKINPQEDHQEQKRNDIISNTIKHLKQLRRPTIEERIYKRQNIWLILVITFLLIANLIQFKINLQSPNCSDHQVIIQDEMIQENIEEPKIDKLQEDVVENLNQQIQQELQNITQQQSTCEFANIERRFQIYFDKFKHKNLDIQDEKSVSQHWVCKYCIKQYHVALSNDSFDIHNDKIKVSFQINGRGVMIGICSHPIQSKNGYSFSKKIGHGCYLISDEGLMYHDVDEEFNNNVKIWTKFTDNSIVYMEYQQYYLEFKTNHGDQVQRIYIDKELQYYNIAIILSETGSKVTII